MTLICIAFFATLMKVTVKFKLSQQCDSAMNIHKDHYEYANS